MVRLKIVSIHKWYVLHTFKISNKWKNYNIPYKEWTTWQTLAGDLTQLPWVTPACVDWEVRETSAHSDRRLPDVTWHSRVRAWFMLRIGSQKVDSITATRCDHPFSPPYTKGENGAQITNYPRIWCSIPNPVWGFHDAPFPPITRTDENLFEEEWT